MEAQLPAHIWLRSCMEILHTLSVCYRDVNLEKSTSILEKKKLEKTPKNPSLEDQFGDSDVIFMDDKCFVP